MSRAEELAKILETLQAPEFEQAATELRRLQAENDRMASELARPVSSEVSTLLAERAQLLAENAELKQRWDRVLKSAEEVHGPDALRFKLSLRKNGTATNCFPTWLDQRWVSFVFAEDDGHLGLHAQIEALKNDAERYRWLKEYYCPEVGRYETPIDRAFTYDIGLDDAIDAAMKGKP